MIKAPTDLQELRRRIYRKTKSTKSHRFWGLFVHITKIETPRVKMRRYPRSTASVWITPKQGSVICSIPGVEPLKMGRIYLAA